VELYTIPEIAEMLKISKNKIYKLVRNGEIPHLRIQKNVRIRKKDLEAWLDRHFVDK
jgi:putative molybdopterin biosynthesis protein